MSQIKKRKKTEYGRQLQEKQDLKKIYGLRENQMRRTVEAARRMSGNTSENLLIILESRLDNVIFRLGLAKTRAQARQYVTHGLFKLNGKKVDIPSILLSPDDKVSPRKLEQFDGKEISMSTVDWLKMDKKSLEGEVLRSPTREDIDTPIDEKIVMQFYSR